MNLSSENLIILSLVLPIIASFLIILADKKPNLREAITLITATAVGLMVITLGMRVLDGEQPELFITEVIPGISINFMFGHQK